MNSAYRQIMNLAVVATAVAIHVPADAQVQTNNLKCAPSTSSDPGMPKAGKWHFLSLCAENVGFGFGRWDGTLLDGSDIIKRRFGKVSEGRFYGFVLDVTIISPKTAKTGVTFLVDGKPEFHFDGLGLLVDEKAVAGTQIGYMPKRGSSLTDSIHVLSYAGTKPVPKQGIFLQQYPCGLVTGAFPQLKCSRDSAVVWSYSFGETPVLCPKPEDVNDCLARLNDVIEPLIVAIEETVREKQAYLKFEGAGFSRKISRIAQNSHLEKFAKLQGEIDTANQQLKLGKMGVGELFALQDELRAKGEQKGSRAVLRMLVQRFPDERLAEIAAKLLLANLAISN